MRAQVHGQHLLHRRYEGAIRRGRNDPALLAVGLDNVFMEWPAPALRHRIRCRCLNREERAMTILLLGIDLGKNSCSLAGLDERGAVVLRRRMQPATVVTFAAKLAPCTIAMEACCGAHYLGRTMAAQGHTVKLMAPEYVRPYVKAQKNDDRDAEAIAEAATRPTMRFVELKSQE